MSSAWLQRSGNTAPAKADFDETTDRATSHGNARYVVETIGMHENTATQHLFDPRQNKAM
jgi:hypothetical protein